MVIKKVGVGKTRSVKIADYQYFKPEVYLEAEIDENDTVDAVSNHLSGLVDQELDIMTAQESARFQTVVEVRELRQVMREHDEDDTEYKLAAARLIELTGKGK